MAKSKPENHRRLAVATTSGSGAPPARATPSLALRAPWGAARAAGLACVLIKESIPLSVMTASACSLNCPRQVSHSILARAADKVEAGNDTETDLGYLLGKATSLGGLRPKSTVLEEDGALAIGKFASIKDERSIVRGEVRALKPLAHAGSRAARARVVTVEGADIAVIRRIDRNSDGARLPCLSGGGAATVPSR